MHGVMCLLHLEMLLVCKVESSICHLAACGEACAQDRSLKRKLSSFCTGSPRQLYRVPGVEVRAAPSTPDPTGCHCQHRYAFSRQCRENVCDHGVIRARMALVFCVSCCTLFLALMG